MVPGGRQLTFILQALRARLTTRWSRPGQPGRLHLRDTRLRLAGRLISQPLGVASIWSNRVTHHHWQYFIALEADFAQTTNFVELVEDNFATYSIAYVKILLSASSEIDVVFRVIAAELGIEAPLKSIKDHREMMLRRYPKFHRVNVQIPRYDLALRPWASWEKEDSPSWWQAYNNVKHHRNSNYPDANLRNALDSVAGLFAALLYLYHDDLFSDALTPWPTLFTVERIDIAFSREDRYRLPDFGRFGDA